MSIMVGAIITVLFAIGAIIITACVVMMAEDEREDAELRRGRRG